MGILLNPSSMIFQNALNSEIYVDKTGLIAQINKFINTEQKYICVSRPRRFGKTMALNMMASYYNHGLDTKAMFSNLKIAQDESFDEHLNKYEVIRITMTDYIGESDENINDSLKQLVDRIERDLIKEYPDIDFSESTRLSDYFAAVYLAKQRQFVILIDEWDSIYRERENDESGQKAYLDFLRNWLKNKEYVALAYMTGILPIKKYGKHSALNMFDEYSMENAYPFTEYIGFTAEEVRALCDEYAMDYRQCQDWYDGYTLKDEYFDKKTKTSTEKVFELYNPLSVVKVMLTRKYRNYWNKTETYEALRRYILLDMEGLKELIIRLIAGEHIKVDISSYSNDMSTFTGTDDVLTLLIHLGYLGYDSEAEEVFVPNNEVRAEFATSIKTIRDWKIISNAIAKSEDLLKATHNLDSEFVANAIEAAHFETSILQYNDENALSYVIALAYYSARRKYTIVREMPAGKGFADLVFIPRPNYPDLPAMIIELKWNHSAETAINQIKNNKYADMFKGYTGKLLIVGVNYNKDDKGESAKKHTCLIEEYDLQ